MEPLTGGSLQGIQTHRVMFTLATQFVSFQPLQAPVGREVCCGLGAGSNAVLLNLWVATPSQGSCIRFLHYDS